MLPLLNSAFKPGTAVEVVERFEDSDFRNIARAELFYFSGRAKRNVVRLRSLILRMRR